MFRLSAHRISLAAFALLLGAGLAQAQTPVTPLTAAPTSVSISYSLQTSTAGAAVPVTLTVASGAGDAFVINPSTIPFWLSLSATSGTAVPAKPGPAITVSFNAGPGAATLTAGVYTFSVHVGVSGFQDLVIPVSLAVSGAPSALSVLNGASPLTSPASIPLTYTYGSTTYPSQTLTLFSSNDPISYTLTSAVTTPANTVDWIQLSATTGLAYNYGSGTTFTISFLPAVFQNASVGQVLNGAVTIHYGANSTFVVNVAITVTEPNAAVTSIFPQEVAPQASGFVTVVVNGSGFGNTGGYAANPSVVTLTYGTASTGVLTAIGGTVQIPNANTMVLKIPYQDNAGTPVAILAAGTVGISITNGLGGEVAATATLTVSASPIVYSVTDAAALVEPAPGAAATVAPYELISIFGTNFCPTCAAPVQGTLTANRYPASLTAGGHTLTVGFYHSDGTTLIANAYLLFATNTQINALVPSTVVAGDDPMQIIVTYNALPSNANVVYNANVVAAKPGIFTISSSGQGQGAVLLANDSVNSSTNTAALGSTVLIYLSGMGIPNSTAADTALPSAGTYPAGCVSVANYVTQAGLTLPATADGAVLQATDIANHLLPPCFVTAPTVSIGGSAATVTYAGWVSGSVAGLYQINATVPSKAAAGNDAVVVTMGTGVNAVSSQAGVTIAVQ
jgi:uncharacterized protein (TIGR03437 family)